MIAVDGKLVARLRRRVRARVKANFALKEERKRLRPRRAWSQVKSRIYYTLWFVAMAWILTAGGTAPVGLVLDCFMIWGASTMLMRAQQIVSLGYDPNILWVSYVLPVADDTIFSDHRRLVLQDSLWSLGECLAFGALVAFAYDAGPAGWLAVPLLGAAFWAVSLALGAALVCFRPSLPFHFGSMGIWVIFMFAIFFRSNGPFYLQYLAAPFSFLRTLLPHGWLATFFERAATRGEWLSLLPLAGLALGAGFALPRLSAALRTRFYPERVFGYEEPPPEAGGSTSVEASEPAPADTYEPTLPAVSPEEVRPALREELERPAGLMLFERGSLDRWIARALGERTRIVVDCLWPTGPSWVWRLGGAVALLVLGRLLQASGVYEGDRIFVGAATVILMAMCTLPLLGGGWLGFSEVGLGHLRVAWYVLMPLGFGEVARTLLLVNSLRIALCVPLFLAAGLLCFSPTPPPFLVVCDYTARCLLLVLCVQPLVLIFLVERLTQVDRSRWWLYLLKLGLLVGVIFFALFMTIAAFAADHISNAYLLLAITLALSFGALFVYGWLWNRSWFDLSGKLVDRT